MKQIILACCLFVAACAAPVTHNTASGKPEVTIAAEDVDAVKASLINKMLNKGYTITKDTNYMIAFDRPVDNVLAGALFGSRYDSQPNARVSYTIAKAGSSIRVISDLAIITNPGSSFERRSDLNNSQDSVAVQAMLDDCKIEIEATVAQ